MLLSRVAGNAYWISRYLERAENTARLINVTGHLLLDLPQVNLPSSWGTLCTITGMDELFFEHHEAANELNITQFLIADKDNPNSIITSFAMARENLRTTRDIIPSDAWESLNDLYMYTERAIQRGLTKRERYDFLKRVISGCQQIWGGMAGTMTRGAAYDFLRMGRYLERADMTTRILDVRSANLLSSDFTAEDKPEFSPYDNIQWMSVLRSLSAYEMYRQKLRVRVKGTDVVKFLLQDNEFPRSVLFSLMVLESCLARLPKNEDALRHLARLQRKIKSADVYELLEEHNKGLHALIDELQIDLGHLHGSVTATYFGVGKT